MLNNRNDVEREGTEVNEHTGDIDKRRKEENALTTKENGEKKPRKPLGECSGRRLRWRESTGFGTSVTETR